MTLDATVVIPALDAAETIQRQLDALACQRFGGTWEVLVADNGSVDGTPAVVRAFEGPLDVRVVDASSRRGASAARNVGAVHARGRVLAFCDADDEVAPNWLGALVEAAESTPLVGGPLDVQTLNPGGAGQARSLHLQPALQRALGFLPYLYSGNMAIVRDVLHRLGGWSERYANGEDVELSWRAQLSGHRLAWVPDAIVRYRLPGDIPTTRRKSFRFGRAETLLFSDFSAQGMPRSNARIAARHWAWLLTRSPLLMHSGWAGHSLWWSRAGYRSGRLVGSLQRRVCYL